MKDFFEQAIQAAIAGEQQSRERDITLYQELFDRTPWNDQDFDLSLEIEERASNDPILSAKMREIEAAYLEREGLTPTPEDYERAHKMVQHLIRQYNEER